jgi:hypothetical protein
MVQKFMEIKRYRFTPWLSRTGPAMTMEILLNSVPTLYQ